MWFLEACTVELAEMFDDGESELWTLLQQFIPTLSALLEKGDVNLLSFSTHAELCDYLASIHMRDCQRHKRFTFLGSQLLKQIAEEKRSGLSALGGKGNFSNDPCVYLFASLAKQKVVKVGETDNPTQRIAQDHLRTGQGLADIRWHYHAQGRWPQALMEDELVLLVLHLRTGDKLLRQMVEVGLKVCLLPQLN
jgi:hypothetical protein